MCGGSGADGLRWSIELDLDAVFGAIGRPQADWTDIDQDEDLAAELAACDREGAPAAAGLTGAIAETLAAGPSLAAWLSGCDPAAAAGHDLIGMAGAFRRVASWAQAGELAMVARVVAQPAAADPRAGLAPDGRPAQLTEDATAQVSLGLTLSHHGAEAWTELAVALRWRLPATAAALAEGRIDTYRAKILAEAVIPLSDAAARTVEDRVVPLAGTSPTGSCMPPPGARSSPPTRREPSTAGAPPSGGPRSACTPIRTAPPPSSAPGCRPRRRRPPTPVSAPSRRP
jgi:hypothetical protein